MTYSARSLDGEIDELLEEHRFSILTHDRKIAERHLELDLSYHHLQKDDLYNTSHSVLLPAVQENLVKAKAIIDDIAEHCHLILNNSSLLTSRLSTVLDAIPNRELRRQFLKNLEDLATEEKIIKFVEDLEVGPFRDLVQVEVGMVGVWKALKELPPSVRSDIFNLETVSRHLDETGKLADDVAAEIAQSGSYNKWLSDHFVTYIKNGYKLTKVNIDDIYANHLQVVLRVEKANAAGVVGGHSRNAFMSELYDPNNAPNKRVVLHTNETGNGVDGFTTVEYKTYAVQAPPNEHLLQQPLTFNGNPPTTGVKTKTLYDPSVVPQPYLKEMAYKGFKDAIDNNRFPGTFFEGHVDNIKVVGHTNPDGGIASWWLEPL